MKTSPAIRAVLDGIKQAIPIVLGFVPVGFAYGMLAQKTGMSDLNILLMSIIVFAGSAQLVAVGMIGAAADPLSIVLTAFIVNLRHLLMSASISPHLKGWSKPQIAAMTFEMTDETFALNSARFASGNLGKVETFAINVTAQLSWITGTWLGMVLSSAVGDVNSLGLDYALPAMFMALLAAQVKNLTHVVVAVFSGGLAVVLWKMGLTQWNVILATVAAATLGTWMESWTRK